MHHSGSPPQEAARLAVLRAQEILDTPAEDAFDDVVVVAAQVAGTPIALVSLVDAERQWFKAHHGLELCETTREVSFCAHAIRGTGPLIVPDARRDPRFAGNPLVTGGPRCVFYAGVPLVVDGQALGTLCVLDRQARTLTSGQLTALEALARQVERLLATRRTGKALATAAAAAEMATFQAQNNRRSLEAVLAAAPIGIFLTDRDGSCTYANPALAVITGQPAAAALGDGWARTIHPEDLARVAGEWSRVLRTGEAFRSQYRFLRPDGSVAWVQVQASEVVGQARGRVGMVEDITRSRQDEVRFRLLFEHAQDGHLLVDHQRGIVDCNEAMLAMVGATSRNQVLGRTPQFFSADPQLDGRPLAEHHRENLAQLAEGRSIRFDWLRRRLDGKSLPVEVQLSPILIEGRPGVLAIWHDISQRKDLERSLREVARAKSDFLAVMSHEIRTPLNGVLGIAQLLAREDLSSLQRDYVQIIRSCGEGLLAIINDILDFSKIEAGRMELERIPFEPRAVVEDAVGIIVGQAREKGLALVIEPTAEPLIWLLGDPNRLRQILLNLAGNAVKFTVSGEVRLGWRTDSGVLEMTVQDTGMGIPEERQALLFQPFTQVDSSIAREHGGTGLGLAISRRLAQAMGGEITVVSRLGWGSRFTVRLPAPIVAGPSGQDRPLAVAQGVAPGQLAGMRVLVAEDNPVNQRVILAFLHKMGCQVVVVEDGAAAVEACRSGGFSVVFMDCQMPVLDGYEATRRIRALDGTVARVRIIALTANASVEDQTLCRTAGMDGYLAKPLRLEVLERCLVETLGLAGGQR